MSIRRSPAEMSESSGVTAETSTAEHSAAEHSAGDVCGPHCLVLHVPRWLCLLSLSLFVTAYSQGVYAVQIQTWTYDRQVFDDFVNEN